MIQFFNDLRIKHSLNKQAEEVKIEPAKAKSILDNVLAANNFEPAKSFQPEVKSRTASTNRIIFQGTFATATAACVAFGALIFSPPTLTHASIINVVDEYTNDSVLVATRMSSPFGDVKNAYALSESGEQLDVTITNKNELTFWADSNGNYTVHAVGANNQTASLDVTVDSIDRDAPRVVDFTYDSSELEIFLEDPISGVNLQEVFGRTADGEVILPLYVSKDKHSVTFAIPDKSFYLFVSDYAGCISTYQVDPIIK